MKTLRQLREGIAVKSNVQWLLPTFTIISGLVERGQRTPEMFPSNIYNVSDFNRGSIWIPLREKFIQKLNTPAKGYAVHTTSLKFAEDVLQNKVGDLSVMAKFDDPDTLFKGSHHRGVSFLLYGTIKARGIDDIFSVPDRSGTRWVSLSHIFNVDGPEIRGYKKNLHAINKILAKAHFYFMSELYNEVYEAVKDDISTSEEKRKELDKRIRILNSEKLSGFYSVNLRRVQEQINYLEVTIPSSIKQKYIQIFMKMIDRILSMNVVTDYLEQVSFHNTTFAFTERRTGGYWEGIMKNDYKVVDAIVSTINEYDRNNEYQKERIVDDVTDPGHPIERVAFTKKTTFTIERMFRASGVYPTIYHFVADEFSRDSLYVSREESYEHDPLFLDIVQPKIDKWDMLLRDSWEDARKIV